MDVVIVSIGGVLGIDGVAARRAGAAAGRDGVAEFAGVIGRVAGARELLQAPLWTGSHHVDGRRRSAGGQAGHGGKSERGEVHFEMERQGLGVRGAVGSERSSRLRV